MDKMTLANTEERGFFYNKVLHVELQNLGTYTKAEYNPVLYGTWSFEWNLQGKECVKEYSLSAPLGETGATVTRAEITPISLYVEYDFPREEIPQIAYDENDEEIEFMTNAEPPQLMGVIMKDGTRHPFLFMGPGSTGYLDVDSNRYMTSFAIDRIIDEEQVESLLFRKSSPEGDEEFTPDNFYEVVLSQ